MAWERSAGVCTCEERAPSLEELRRTEWSPEFEALMRRRLIMGALRYGRLGELGKPQWRRVSNMIERLRYYERSRNTEALVDVANLALCEYVEGGGTWRGAYTLHTKRREE